MSEQTNNTDLHREYIRQRLEARLRQDLQREVWSTHNAVRFCAQTTTWMFAQWMVATTELRRVDTESGFYSLSNASAWPHPWQDQIGPITVEIMGSHDREDLEKDEHISGPYSAQITFHAQPISSKRIEVKATCKAPALQVYFQEMLSRIGEAFDVPTLLPQAETLHATQSKPMEDVSGPTERALARALAADAKARGYTKKYKAICEDKHKNELVSNIAAKYQMTASRVYQIHRDHCHLCKAATINV